MTFPLNLIKDVDSTYYHVFKMSDNSKVRVVCTKEEYEAMDSMKDNFVPGLIPNATDNDCSFRRNVWNTFDGEPHAGDVEDLGQGKLKFWISSPDIRAYQDLGSNFTVDKVDYVGLFPRITIITPIDARITVINGVLELL